MPVQGPPTLSAVAADPEDDDAQRKVRDRARAFFFARIISSVCIAAAGPPERSMNERPKDLENRKNFEQLHHGANAAPPDGRWTAA